MHHGSVSLVDAPLLRPASGTSPYVEGGVAGFGGATCVVASFRKGTGAAALGPNEAEALTRLLATATDTGVPFVLTMSSAGADVGQGIASLHAWGRVAAAMSRASGVVPLVIILDGPSVSGPALLLGLADVVIATPRAFAYVTSPEAALHFTGEEVTREGLGGVRRLASTSGTVAAVADDLDDAMAIANDVLLHLAPNCMAHPVALAIDDDPHRKTTEAAAAVPANPGTSYDVRTVVADVVDQGDFLEMWQQWAPSIVTGFATVGGEPVGVVANQPSRLAGTLNIESSHKGARFVQLCDAFNVPLVTFVDTPGFQPGKDIEWKGMIRHGAQLVHAYALATVPRVCVVLRKAYGGAYIVMDSKRLGNDACFAWPQAEIAVMGAPAATNLLHGRKGLPAEELSALQAEYEREHCTPAIALSRGYVDEVISPEDTRRAVWGALRSFQHKREHLPKRKHSLSPL